MIVDFYTSNIIVQLGYQNLILCYFNSNILHAVCFLDLFSFGSPTTTLQPAKSQPSTDSWASLFDNNAGK